MEGDRNIERTEVENKEDRLIVNNMCYVNRDGVKVLNHVSFTAKSGEILGIAGTVCLQKQHADAHIYRAGHMIGRSYFVDRQACRAVAGDVAAQLIPFIVQLRF